ncbi:o-succinylbenzoate synthase [Gracilimonas mengyeensis]|uniref:o-succinylbenzoate synthase n=1 Tax=Gracilimonas mengyeensis TaxID=1302730 RepID=A0A521ADP7_9BACT|nr:o-succinylbenzoate synthase [Gracilimonas mengyeensis]SMO32919.1 o-succinylbenzoate synthase [Gracilimonas mengyeensis]
MLSFYTYKIPFTKPFRTAGLELHHRKGIILVFRDEENEIEAYGEAAPLPGFSSENLQQVKEVLKLNRDIMNQALMESNGRDILNMLDQIHQLPSLSFGFDTLIHDLEAKREGKPLVNYLFDEEYHHPKVNAVLPIGKTSETIGKAKKLVKEGFQTLKLKVGQDFERERILLQKLREQFPSIKMRIDANGSWSPEEARDNLNALQKLNIEYCEQPLSPDLWPEHLNFSSKVDVDIAADESIVNASSVVNFAENEIADIFIIKPMLLGSYKKTYVTKENADTHNIKMVFTTLLESGIGRAATAALAGGCGSTNHAHGLLTGPLLQNDPALAKWINQPKISFPDAPGLGIFVHSEGLEKF